MKTTFIESVETENTGGDVMVDFVRLKSGIVIGITDECLTVASSQDEWNNHNTKQIAFDTEEYLEPHTPDGTFHNQPSLEEVGVTMPPNAEEFEGAIFDRSQYSNIDDAIEAGALRRMETTYGYTSAMDSIINMKTTAKMLDDSADVWIQLVIDGVQYPPCPLNNVA